MSTYYGNIFEEFMSVKKAVMESYEAGIDYYCEEHFKLIEAIETYFRSMKWAKNDGEKAIYLRSGKGIKTSVIAKSLDINPNTYRYMISSLSKRLREMLFDGQDASTAILSANEDKAKKIRRHVEFLYLDFDFYSMYSNHQLELMQRYSETSEVVAEPTEQELFDALMVLVFMNNRTTEYRLQALNPLALRRIIAELSSGKDSIWINYYQALGVGSRPVMSMSRIQNLKESVN